ncbi:hypothetical protein O1611_g3213 [Lasiodiplodia mahajangana]|uniref:Uncharacterized protein n=1 Tax=Lasiodiplodia mahajangana TaxID=1108764 RepID=A0ACC2JTB1_9PEZI|nr:hypothetical protein O1611_g3213 [Lasiodiplodia mahajangana]
MPASIKVPTAFVSAMLIFTTLLLLAEIPQGWASPTPTTARRRGIHSASTFIGNGPCSLDRNSDLYGLGIRIGIYIQGVATLWAMSYRQTAAAELCKVGGLFQFAVLVALIRETVTNDNFNAVEALVTYLLGVLSFGVNVTDALGTDREEHQNYLERKTISSLSVSQTWFWFVGLNKLERLPCKTETFFF